MSNNDDILGLGGSESDPEFVWDDLLEELSKTELREITIVDSKNLSQEELDSITVKFYEYLTTQDVYEIEVTGLILDDRLRMMLESLGFKIEKETISSFYLNIPQRVEDKLNGL